MDSILAGELVKVATGGPELDGIVFDTPSRSKVVVAVIDPDRGPVMRTFDASALSERTEEGPQEKALRALVRRTPPPAPGGSRGGVTGGPARGGHARGAGRRPAGQEPGRARRARGPRRPGRPQSGGSAGADGGRGDGAARLHAAQQGERRVQ